MQKKETFFNGKKFNETKITELLNEFFMETPRAVAIICGTYLDNLLNELLRSRLVKDEALFKEIDNLTFKRRINLCYLIGLISNEERHDLKKINWIRNQFAHDINLNSFDKNTIPVECNNLKFTNYIQKKFKQSDSDNREKFMIAIVYIMGTLHNKIKNCKRIEKKKNPWRKK